MSDQTAQEPTMEEILASIRRIISEDDAPAEAAASADVAEPEEPAEEEDDVLELTQDMREPVDPVGDDLEVYTPQAVEAEPEPAPPPPPAPEPVAAPSPAVGETLVGAAAATAAASAFGQLTAAISMPKDGRTLEDVTRELLKPLLKEWLDENLPRIVQAAVEEEVQRIARGRMG